MWSLQQEAPDFVNSLSLKVEIEQQSADENPVLDVSSPSAWEFFVSDWLTAGNLWVRVDVLGKEPDEVTEDCRRSGYLEMFVQSFKMTWRACVVMITGF